MCVCVCACACACVCVFVHVCVQSVWGPGRAGLQQQVVKMCCCTHLKDKSLNLCMSEREMMGHNLYRMSVR
jgi:hypothetical protein